MKKFLATALVMAMTVSLVACGTSGTKENDKEVSGDKVEAQAGDEGEAAGDAADTAYPERNINMTIPFGAGGGTDVWARIMAQYMGEELGVQIIANNITGGSAGSTGVDSVWKAPHDGYSLAGTSETPLTIPVMTPLEQTTKDWEYFIAAGSPGLLCVRKDAGYDSLEAVVEKLKADPESISIAGTTGGLWFALAQLFDTYGETPFQWVSYPGSADAIKATHAGETDTVVASAGEVKSYVESGDFIPVAVMGKEAWEFPGVGEIPAVIDVIPELEAYLPLNQVLGFKVPADTDPAIIAKLDDAFHKAMANPAVKEAGDEQLCVLYDLSGAEAKEMMTGIEKSLCWILFDMGQTTFSPEERGIERP